MISTAPRGRIPGGGAGARPGCYRLLSGSLPGAMPWPPTV